MHRHSQKFVRVISCQRRQKVEDISPSPILPPVVTSKQHSPFSPSLVDEFVDGREGANHFFSSPELGDDCFIHRALRKREPTKGNFALRFWFFETFFILLLNAGPSSRKPAVTKEVGLNLIASSTRTFSSAKTLSFHECFGRVKLLHSGRNDDHTTGD